MTAKVICLASPKGGSGKTILTCTFGTFLSHLNKKVLLIDSDIATNGLSLLHLKEVAMQREIALSENRNPLGIFELSVNEIEIEIVKLKNGIDLIPASYEFLNKKMPDCVEFELILKTTIKKLADSYDYIFLDSQAGADECARAAMSKSVSDEVVIVTEYDPMSAAGVERLKGILRNDLTYNRTWILINKVLPDFMKSFSDFLEVAKYLSPIPWDADVVRAYARRRIALDMDKGNEHTLAVMQTLKALLGEEFSDEITGWAKEKASIIIHPIKEQYDDTKKQLDALIEYNYKKEKFNKNRTYMIFLTSMIMGVAASITFSNIYSSLFPKFFNYISPELLTITILSVVVASVNILFLSRKTNTKEVLEKADQEREKERLEEKLKMLQALKDADLETLLKHRK